jgi:outer membrane immunogenic protein
VLDSAAKIQLVAPLQKHHTVELSARLAELILSIRVSYGMLGPPIWRRRILLDGNCEGLNMSKSLMIAAGILAASVTVAMAADMRMPVKAPPIVEPPISWSGFYLGGDVGGSWGRGRSDQTDVTTTTTTSTAVTNLFRGTTGPIPTGGGIPGTFPQTTTTGPTSAAVTALTSGKADVNGFMGGGQIGWRQQINTWVLGVEGDIEGSAERGTFQVCSVAGCPTGSTIGTADIRLRWLSTLRGTVGFLVHPKIMIYGTGGLAIGGVSANYLSGINGGSLTAGSVSTTRVGYSVGAGVEGKIDQHWSVRGQYLFVDLGSFDTNLGVGAATTASTTVTGALTPAIDVNGNPSASFNTQTTTTTATSTSTAAQIRSRLRDHVFKLGFNYQF